MSAGSSLAASCRMIPLRTFVKSVCAHVLQGGPIVHGRLQSRSPFGEHIHDLL